MISTQRKAERSLQLLLAKMRGGAKYKAKVVLFSSSVHSPRQQ